MTCQEFEKYQKKQTKNKERSHRGFKVGTVEGSHIFLGQQEETYIQKKKG